MIGSGASHALQDLDRVARDAATTAIVQRTTEAGLILIISIYIYILIRLEAVEVVVLLTRTNYAFFNLLSGLFTIGRLVIVFFSSFTVICNGHRFLLLGSHIGCHGTTILRRAHNFILSLRLLANYAEFLTNVTRCFIPVAINTAKTLD